MQELEHTKAKRVTVPKRVKRYGVAYWTTFGGWQNTCNFHTTPESALEDYLRGYANQTPSDYTPKYYTVYEVDLEVPIVYP